MKDIASRPWITVIPDFTDFFWTEAAPVNVFVSKNVHEGERAVRVGKAYEEQVRWKKYRPDC